MSDDFETAKTALARIHRDMAAINRLARPSYLTVIEQLERTMEPFRRQQLAIGCALENSGASAVKEIAEANQRWQLVIHQATASRRIAESLHAAHQSWLDRLRPLQQDFSRLSQLEASAKLSLCDVSLQLTAAERLMTGVDFEAIRTRSQVDIPAISGLELLIANVAASYGSLAASMREISDITRLPAFVLPGATREIYTTSFALESLRPRDERDEQDSETEIQLVADVEQEVSGCIALLEQVDPGLALPYIGARDALHGTNVDRARHILSSLRELWNHLLRRLATGQARYRMDFGD